MRILLLSYEYPPETGFGGIGTYTWYHARALARLGHEVHVLAGSRTVTELRTTESDGVQVHRYRATGAAMSAAGALSRAEWWWSSNRLENAISMSRGLDALRRRLTVDVIEMPECGGEGLLINGRVDVPTIVRAHSPAELIMPFYPVRRVDTALCAWLERRGINRATALSSCSQFLADELRDTMHVRAPIRVITNGIDLALFDAEASSGAAQPVPVPRDGLTVFFAGRMEARKGIHLCDDIISRVLAQHEVSFVLAGEDLFGSMEREILPSVARKGLKGSVHYVGKLGLDAVRTQMRQADVVILPSLWENCPYSCLEAMAAGRAIVCSRQGGMPELIRDGESGLLAETGNSAMFAHQICRLIEDAELRRRVGAEARATVERNHRDEHVARLSLAFYEECMEAA